MAIYAQNVHSSFFLTLQCHRSTAVIDLMCFRKQQKVKIWQIILKTKHHSVEVQRLKYLFLGSDRKRGEEKSCSYSSSRR